jgi:trehalose 6-phosphate synthase/phosphatase
MPKTIIVSNRLPLTIENGPEGVRIKRSSGGLATAIASSEAIAASIWIGWPGGTRGLNPKDMATVRQRLADEHAVPVDLTDREVEGFYERFSNGAVWPLFHYMPSQLPLRVEGWDEYYRVNQKFAQAVVEHYQPGSHVWVHDYQLMLVPNFVREQLPDARIGFFLHIPFPGAEIFAVLPHREDILQGLLGADLIGFHTARYRQHFETALLRLLGRNTRNGMVKVGNREVRIGVFPISVNASQFEQRAASPEVMEEVELLRSDGCKLLVGVDRLDYTKGIPRRLLSFEYLLETVPEWRGKVRLVQVAVPSREHVGAYRRFRSEVNNLVGSINGRFGTPHWTPVHYLFRSVPETQLLALYRAADVMLVTPIRDGMNLVAKEFVATRSDNDGVLLLSEFAGAAAELTHAVIVNPFDVEATARQIDMALRMRKTERTSRMRSLRETVFHYDVDRWMREFITSLRELGEPHHAAAQ